MPSIVLIILAMGVVEMLSGVTQGYLPPLLPALGPVIGIDDPGINGLFLISNVSFAVMTPIVSRLGDSYGYRLVLRWSTVAVSIGALAMAVAPSLITITIGIVLLTCVVGFIPLMMGILRTTSPAHTRNGVSVMIGVLMITVGFGGLIAGLVGAEDPQRGLWIAVPIAVLSLAATFVLPDAGTPTRQPLAVLPLATCSLGLIGFVVALAMGPEWGWFDVRTLGSGILGVALLTIWVWIDSRKTAKRRTFLDLSMLRIPQIRSITVSTFFFGFATISYFGTNGIFLHADPQEVGYGFGLSPFGVATVLALTSIASLLSSLVTVRMMSVIGENITMLVAGVILAAGFSTILFGHRSFVLYCLGFTLFNVSLGMYQAATRALSVEGVPIHQTSSAAGLNELALSVGIAVGAAMIRMISAASVTEAGKISEGGLWAIWVVLAVAALCAGIAGFSYRRPQYRVSATGTIGVTE
ncbi:MFS transporter [Leucobacter sp. wl10]|uniref:MFS transporter n=1 Tax=Leucobacter sp. wl10 TaxID=2304677 RepID=UPI0013C34DD0|nr:MFS transporter [Leucobacter sp. wl10]